MVRWGIRLWLATLLGAGVVASAQGQIFADKDTYLADDWATLTREHHTVAILPFEVTLRLKPSKRKKLSQAEYNTLLEGDARAVQELLYDFLLKRLQRKEITVEVQDIYQTNTLLLQKGVTSQSLFQYARSDLARLLGVDAVLGGKLSTNRPLADPEGKVPRSVFDALGSTIEGEADLQLHDGHSGKLLWKTEEHIKKKYTRGVEGVYENLLKRASKSLPYFKR